jgi:hypothetical protein
VNLQFGAKMLDFAAQTGRKYVRFPHPIGKVSHDGLHRSRFAGVRAGRSAVRPQPAGPFLPLARLSFFLVGELRAGRGFLPRFDRKIFTASGYEVLALRAITR